MPLQRSTAVLSVVAILLLAIIAGLLGYSQYRTAHAAVTFDTPYQAVLLTSGMVYYGKLEGMGTPNPVLRDIYYVQSAVNPDTKQQTNILVRRGREWHKPDRMYLNPAHILLVEPVAIDSQVAQFIAQQEQAEKK
jgi:hypothetical protein